jgi:hypothetical protein
MTYTIAVDCDEVLIESIRNLTEFCRVHHGIDWKYEDFLYYLISKNPHVHLTDEQAISLFDEYFASPYPRDADAVEGAYAVLQRWKAA